MRPWIAILAGAALHLGGCALIEPVQPWGKGILAKPEMSFEGDRFAYHGSDTAYVGVMAQEVQGMMPDAVTRTSNLTRCSAASWIFAKPS